MAAKISSRILGTPRTDTPRLPRRLIAVGGLIAVLAGVALSAIAVLRHGPTHQSQGAVLAAGEYLLFARFGPAADSILESGPGATRPRLLLEIPHAADYGIVPAVSPDGRRFVYAVLPPDTRAPAPDKPAELWLADLYTATTRRIGAGYDLLVRPLWASDGSSVVLRRSDGAAGPFELLRVDLSSGSEQTLIRSNDALFPVGFDQAGTLLFATLSPAGSSLYRLDPAAGPTLTAHLSDDLTRDWTLSPDGASLAFVSLKQQGSLVHSTVEVLDLRTLTSVRDGPGGADEAGPTWTPAGALSLARVAPGKAGAVVSGDSTLAPPSRGFDVPLSWSRSGSTLAVRTFDGASMTSPGRMALTAVAADGRRSNIASGEVTFIGWTYR